MYAIILIGGICSGKTSLANKLSLSAGLHIVSKDQCIYESDMLQRQGIKKAWDTIRAERISELEGKNLIFDETLRVGKLDEIKRMGYTIIGVQLSTDLAERNRRLVLRNKTRKELMCQLSEISGIDLEAMSQKKRRDLWRSGDFINSIPKNKQSLFDETLKQIYMLGSLFIKDENPNPACFPQLDYIVDFDNLDMEDFKNPNVIISKGCTYHSYLKSWSKKVKYCIWDVGGVFYDYSLQPLNDWLVEHKNNPANIVDSLSQKSIFNDYMSGKMNFKDFCCSLCKLHGIPYSTEFDSEIEKCLHKGIGDMFTETESAILKLKKRGLINCVLSNALPALADDGNYPDLIEPEHRFYSFEIKSLKPNNDIYVATRDNLKTSFNELIFIDDKERNVIAAKDLGIYSITFDRNTILAELSKVFGNL